MTPQSSFGARLVFLPSNNIKMQRVFSHSFRWWIKKRTDQQILDTNVRYSILLPPPGDEFCSDVGAWFSDAEPIIATLEPPTETRSFLGFSEEAIIGKNVCSKKKLKKENTEPREYGYQNWTDELCVMWDRFWDKNWRLRDEIQLKALGKIYQYKLKIVGEWLFLIVTWSPERYRSHQVNGRFRSHQVDFPDEFRYFERFGFVYPTSFLSTMKNLFVSNKSSKTTVDLFKLFASVLRTWWFTVVVGKKYTIQWKRVHNVCEIHPLSGDETKQSSMQKVSLRMDKFFW